MKLNVLTKILVVAFIVFSAMLFIACRNNDNNLSVVNEYYENGNIKKTIRNIKGKPLIIYSYDDTGNLLTTTKIDERYKNGNAKKALIYDSEEKLKEIEEYYKNGKIKSEENYDADGNLSSIHEYDNNEKLKKFSSYRKDGRLISFDEYVEQYKLEKYYYHYNSNDSDGKLVYVVKSVGNIQSFYDEYGILLKVYEYDEYGYGNEVKRLEYEYDEINGKISKVYEYEYESKYPKKVQEYGDDGKISKVYEYDNNGYIQKILQYSKGAFVRNLLETVQCVYDGLLTNAVLVGDATTFEEDFGSVESKIWRKGDSLPSDLKQKAKQGGYKFIAIKSAKGGYYWFRYYNGEWFFAANRLEQVELQK
jgi:hypothetical protein